MIMDKIVNKVILIVFCLTLIPFQRGFAIHINVKSFEKAAKTVTKNVSKEERAVSKSIRNSEGKSSTELQQAVGETNSIGYANAGRMATQYKQCKHCRGTGYYGGVRCGFCNGVGRTAQVMNVVPRSVDKSSEPFWKSTWFFVVCCIAVGFGGGYCWHKAS